jgi:hypothetical protein
LGEEEEGGTFLVYLQPTITIDIKMQIIKICAIFYRERKRESSKSRIIFGCKLTNKKYLHYYTALYKLFIFFAGIFFLIFAGVVLDKISTRRLLLNFYYLISRNDFDHYACFVLIQTRKRLLNTTP